LVINYCWFLDKNINLGNTSTILKSPSLRKDLHDTIDTFIETKSEKSVKT